MLPFLFAIQCAAHYIVEEVGVGRMQMKLHGLLFLVAAWLCSVNAIAYAEGIGWIPSWNQALAEARQTNKPIMLMSGAPACGGVPGVW